MTEKSIYILSITNVATGGTELLQQFCFKLREVGVNAFMYYVTNDFEGSVVQLKFKEYNNPKVDKIVDSKNNILVIPEVAIDSTFQFKEIEKFIWWLSVDNYYGALKAQNNLIKKLYYQFKDLRNNKLLFSSCKHLVQSEYARLFLTKEKNVENKSIRYLSDYLNNVFINSAINNQSSVKKNAILYNPKKGFEFTARLIENITEYEWIPLQNLTTRQMSRLLSECKVYIDFGNHPGKDRIPREAAISGCCVITGKRGASANDLDVRIPEKYKFEDSNENISLIHNQISDCMNNYENSGKDFEEYRQMIIKEEENFIKDIHSFIKSVS